jgi:hypothetical protein
VTATLSAMKAIVLGLLAALSMAASVQAQQVVKVKIFTEKAFLLSEGAQTVNEKIQYLNQRAQFLAQEPMGIMVRVYNYSGETLVLGQQEDWISFSVEPLANKSVVRQTGEPSVAGAFELGNNLMATKRVDLTPYFEIVQPGRYKITATVRVGRFGDVSSEPLLVDMVNGTPLWDHEFGVPAAGDKAPEIRRYQIIQARQMDVQHLYVKVTDTFNSRTYGLYPLGQMVIAQKPEQQIDRNNRLHVLHRSGRSTYTYSMVDYDGQIILRQRYDQAGGPPHLVPTEAGEVLVNGGVRTKSAYDIDPLAEEQELKQKTP